MKRERTRYEKAALTRMVNRALRERDYEVREWLRREAAKMREISGQDAEHTANVLDQMAERYLFGEHRLFSRYGGQK